MNNKVQNADWLKENISRHKKWVAEMIKDTPISKGETV
jgi:hypothetical protein